MSVMSPQRALLLIHRNMRIRSGWSKHLLSGPSTLPYHPSGPCIPRLALVSNPVRALSSEAPTGPGWGTPTADNDRYDNLHVTFRDGVRTITFNRPEKKNALTEKMFADVVNALEEAAKDPDTVVTATTGAGNVFCAGNDKTNFQNLTMKQVQELLTRHMAAFIDFPKPLIAVVNGAAVGAVFFTPFSSLGITLEGCSSFTFPRFMGQAKAYEILMFNKLVTAKEAYDLHLATKVFPASSLYEEVWPRLQTMAKLPQKSLIYSKALTRDVIKDRLHKINIEECKRVTECIMVDKATKEDYDKYIAENF
ncbi:enoyl-CoA delta isomerase 2-like isoform X2 [Portunus trituberculatus]|uniref:enoyl-CoA delta isomerase 2-like isoform X2 n=1 Tax=Portunus trituberculatus TaxID=210409 RepID=UPI001E1D17B7|nr:enoyl-CoA delta isomerase 2-like isoform X2 [Portunus trituberculatus]